MDVTTCSRCGKLFNHISGPRICPVCLKEFDDKFPEVKKYVYEHPHTGIAELSEAMNIPANRSNAGSAKNGLVLQMIRRLELSVRDVAR